MGRKHQIIIKYKMIKCSLYEILFLKTLNFQVILKHVIVDEERLLVLSISFNLRDDHEMIQQHYNIFLLFIMILVLN